MGLFICPVLVKNRETSFAIVFPARGSGPKAMPDLEALSDGLLESSQDHSGCLPPAERQYHAQDLHELGSTEAAQNE